MMDLNEMLQEIRDLTVDWGEGLVHQAIGPDPLFGSRERVADFVCHYADGGES